MKLESLFSWLPSKKLTTKIDAEKTRKQNEVYNSLLSQDCISPEEYNNFITQVLPQIKDANHRESLKKIFDILVDKHRGNEAVLDAIEDSTLASKEKHETLLRNMQDLMDHIDAALEAYNATIRNHMEAAQQSLRDEEFDNAYRQANAARNLAAPFCGLWSKLRKKISGNNAASLISIPGYSEVHKQLKKKGGIIQSYSGGFNVICDDAQNLMNAAKAHRKTVNSRNKKAYKAIGVQRSSLLFNPQVITDASLTALPTIGWTRMLSKKTALAGYENVAANIRHDIVNPNIKIGDKKYHVVKSNGRVPLYALMDDATGQPAIDQYFLNYALVRDNKNKLTGFKYKQTTGREDYTQATLI